MGIVKVTLKAYAIFLAYISIHLLLYYIDILRTITYIT